MIAQEKIRSNSEDRYIMSPSVLEYIHTMSHKYPQVLKSLKVLRSTLANDFSCLC